MDIIKRDLQFGLAKETPILNILEKHFNNKIEKCIDQWSHYDGFSENMKYEIKTRRNKKHAYPTTIISLNKIKPEGDLTFVFQFTDQLCYIKYDEEKFSHYEKQDISAYRGRGSLTSIPHFLIPVEDLTDIPV
jgi:hypothetical protein